MTPQRGIITSSLIASGSEFELFTNQIANEEFN
jgi:hypothetical protein